VRLEGKIAIIIGAGQSPGEGIGNGRATAMRFAQEGARILAVDRDIDSAQETAELVNKEGAECLAFKADVTDESTLADTVKFAHKQWGRIDILHNNVGVSIAGGDQPLLELTEETFDRVNAINLRGTVMACKQVVPIMRKQNGGVIINISSIASWIEYPLVVYKITKAAMIAFTQQLALQNASHGIRANAIMPGLMNTPMAIEGISQERGIDRETLVSARNAAVPLRGKMGTAWDVAYASLFLASDEANFITGVLLPVDGGTSVKVG